MKYKFLLIISALFLGCSPPNDSNKNAVRSNTSIDAEKIFKTQCASCHRPQEDMTGPALRYGSEHLGRKEKLTDFVQNSISFSNDAYITSLKKKYESKYTHKFNYLTTEEIMSIIYWCDFYDAEPGK